MAKGEEERWAFPAASRLSFKTGMTLREWYAGMAMQGVMSCGLLKAIGKESDGEVEISFQVMAHMSFRIADAMMREVEKREENQDG